MFITDERKKLVSFTNALFKESEAIVTPKILTLYLKVLSSKEYIPEIPGSIAAAVRKSDTPLLDALNKVIDGMKEDLTIQKILKSYGVNGN
ncbi:transporter substrate-binding domain-containing protein [Clostridium sp. SHJSY1]|uniref:transporter substrate-binding domain-containing protein n=1 Tax=Clostridium sp. SHJSY1 TaxID=2942483 RepID=UPI002874C002|nr:transporter substrate-binding domain-containing protein [Clostridium sp. SHJSY1]MDS0528578.1 transporter substrate-binding domain-containing protein [Clostridium sp. SHJSY1]